MKLKMLSLVVIAVAALSISYCKATPVIDSAQAAEGGTSLSLPSGSQLYVFGMANGGMLVDGPFANGQTVSVTDAAGVMGAELAATTVNSNSFQSGTTYHVIDGFGVSDFNYAQGFYGANPGPSAYSASVEFTLTAPSLVVLFGQASSQQYIAFSGIPNLVTAAPYTTEEALSIAYAYLDPGTYTAQDSSLDTAPDQTPDYMVNLLGVLILSDQPNAATSSNSEIPLPAQTVPEPSELALFTLCGLLLGFRRLRK